MPTVMDDAIGIELALGLVVEPAIPHPHPTVLLRSAGEAEQHRGVSNAHGAAEWGERQGSLHGLDASTQTVR
jgi:hypothetical protein